MKLYRLSTWLVGHKRYVCGNPKTGRMGYTRQISSAGLYTTTQAKHIAGRLRRIKTRVKLEAAA
jgi:hypothetical protein